MKTTTWTTPKGAEIVLVTEHVTEDTVNLDGHKATVKADRIEVRKVTLNGREHQARLTQHNNKPVLHLGYKTMQGQKHPLLALIPDKIYQEVWGEYDARKEAAIKAELEAEYKYQEHYNKVKNAMKE